VILYLDSSALVKLVIPEAESVALSGYMSDHAGDGRMTSALARTEVVRAIRAATGSEAAVGRARTLLSSFAIVPVHVHLLDSAADLPGALRTLDAIHIASAHYVRPQLRALVTYDQRMAAAAEANGLPVVAPA
jgi:predicted nucleic acid-binding protein